MTIALFALGVACVAVSRLWDRLDNDIDDD